MCRTAKVGTEVSRKPPAPGRGVYRMSMSEFIKQHMELILTDWEEFAASLHPAAGQLSPEELRDYGKEVLTTVADDMETRKSSVEQGEGARTDEGHTPEVTESARKHAADRLHEGFTLIQMVKEYQALRASVTRRWAAQLSIDDAAALRDLARFNEALDQSMIEAVAWYSDRMDEARDLFTGALAHDLRNPLGAIIMLADTLLAAEGLESQYIKSIARIRNSGSRMAHMVGDLLDFTRARLGTGLRIVPTATDLAQHCKAVIDELRASHPDRVFETQFFGDLNGSWDAPRLDQMLSNLLGNAVTFGHRDTPIALTARQTGEEVSITVHNDGPHIPVETQRTIFDPLVRVASEDSPAERHTDGLGLGLYIADQIASAHGGSIELHSTAGDGTTFTVPAPYGHGIERRHRNG